MVAFQRFYLVLPPSGGSSALKAVVDTPKFSVQCYTRLKNIIHQCEIGSLVGCKYLNSGAAAVNQALVSDFYDTTLVEG